MWDKGVFTELTTSANRPDIIVHNKKDKLCLLIDIVIPMDHNKVVKENDKLTKYKNLGINISRSWNTRTQIVAVVIGALGYNKKGFQKKGSQVPSKCRRSCFVLLRTLLERNSQGLWLSPG